MKTLPYLVQIPVCSKNSYPDTPEITNQRAFLCFQAQCLDLLGRTVGRGTEVAHGLSDFRDTEKRDTSGQVKLENALGANGVGI